MSTPVGNSAANASGNGPALGYSLKLWLFILFMLICVISINMFTCFILLLKVIEILLVYTFNFGIKIYRKLPTYLTHPTAATRSNSGRPPPRRAPQRREAREPPRHRAAPPPHHRATTPRLQPQILRATHRRKHGVRSRV